MKKLVLAIITMALFLFVACNKDLLSDKESLSINKQQGVTSDGNTGSVPEGMTQLGRQLKNPYSVENMREAFKLIQPLLDENDQKPNVRVTHYYVKFNPGDQQELDLLKADTSVEFFEYPLDYEIIKPGVYYREPGIPDGVPTPQYVAVPENYNFPPVDYQILDELYIPEEVEKAVQSEIIDDLVDQALALTDNLIGGIFKRPSKWNPDGFIRGYDNILNGLIPLEGVKVRATRWFTTKTDYTDANGYYRTGSFRRPVNYSIKWETSKYDIRSGTWGQAKYDGPKIKGRWNLDIQSWYGSTLGYATVHRAAHRYFFRNTGGLKRPGNVTKLKFNYYHDKQGTGVNWGNWDPFGVFPDVKLYGKDGSGNWYDENELYSTTIHEIAHTSHIKLMTFVQYVQVSKIIYESWANAVEFYLTQLEYRELGVSDYDDPDENEFIDNMQRWDQNGSHDYTPLFVDFIDTYNQSLRRGPQPDPCPDFGDFDGANCYVGTPPAGESAFIYADNFYYTPVGCCECPMPGSSFDGANCYVRAIPDDRLGFIWQNNWYLMRAGNPDNPFDAISGYTMGNIESKILRYSYGLTSLRDKLKEHKPSGVTDKHIDLYLDYYFSW